MEQFVAAAMTWAVEWPALMAIVGAIVTITLAVSGFACWLLWKAWTLLDETRKAVNLQIEAARKAIEKKVDELEGMVNGEVDALDQRLRKVEIEQAIATQLRSDFGDLRREIGKKIDDLRNERREDMRGIHSRLNEVLMTPTRGSGE